MWPKIKKIKMATGPKAGLYQNVQSASYFPPTLEFVYYSIRNEFVSVRMGRDSYFSSFKNNLFYFPLKIMFNPKSVPAQCVVLLLWLISLAVRSDVFVMMILMRAVLTDTKRAMFLSVVSLPTLCSLSQRVLRGFDWWNNKSANIHRKIIC